MCSVCDRGNPLVCARLGYADHDVWRPGGPNLGKDRGGRTAIQLAALGSFTNCARLARGADVNAATLSGRPAAVRITLDANSPPCFEQGARQFEDRSFARRSAVERKKPSYVPGHSGWAVKTRNHLLIFDYFSGDDPAGAALCNGRINPAEIKTGKWCLPRTSRPLRASHIRLAGRSRYRYFLGLQPQGAPAWVHAARMEQSFGDIGSHDSFHRRGVGMVVEVDG
jgi:hypothetical protein